MLQYSWHTCSNNCHVLYPYNVSYMKRKMRTIKGMGMRTMGTGMRMIGMGMRMMGMGMRTRVRQAEVITR